MNTQWRNAPDFAEIAEALKCQTVDIMAALATPDGSFMAMFTPEPDAEDPMIYSSMLRRDADDILVAGPRREVETTSSFMEKMNIQVGARLEEEFGPPSRGSIQDLMDEFPDGRDGGEDEPEPLR